MKLLKSARSSHNETERENKPPPAETRCTDKERNTEVILNKTARDDDKRSILCRSNEARTQSPGGQQLLC